MANIIQRIIQLVLDKDAAKKMQSDTETAQNAIEKSWKDMAGRVAGYLGVAFLIKKVVDFGKAAVEEASNSQAAWAALKNTIDNTGASFDKIEVKVRGMADAFQDATIHDDDAFAESLGRMVSLTDDVTASLNNMGLVANVAAKFFRGDLESATAVVAKAMNGNTNALKKMGIQAESAQEALEILAKRSMGAAEREAQTYGGQIKQLNNQYNDMLKVLGEAIISSDGAADGFSILRAAVAQLSDWLVNNKETITLWVTNGVKFAIDASDVFIRAIIGMSNMLGGGFATAIGYAAIGISKFAEGLLAVRGGISALERFFGKDTSHYDKTTEELAAQTKALHEWGEQAVKLGEERVKKGLAVLSTPLFSSEDFSAGKRPKPPKTPGEENAPMVGKNVSTDATEAVKKAIKEFNEAVKTADNMKKILGDRFDSVGADVERTTKLLNVLAATGIEPASVGFKGLGEHLAELTGFTVPMTTAAKELDKALNSGLAISAITAADSINPLSDRLDLLKTQQADTLKSIQTLVDAGISPASDAVQQLGERYRMLGAQIKEANIQATFHDLAVELSGNLFQATLDSADQMEMLKIEHNALQKAIQSLLAQGVSKEDEAFKRLVARYGEVTKAIDHQTTAMKIQAATADVLAEALGAALQGGLAQAASQKAKQNAIEAAEMLVRAGVFALFGDYAHASASLALAAQFAAVSVAWAALGAASRGGGGGGSGAPNVSGSPASTGGDLASGRNASGDAAANATAPSAEVSIFLTGPGFHAMNPAVQKVVRGAYQQSQELYGKDARVRIVPQEG